MFLHYLKTLKDYIISSLDHTKQAAIMLMTGHTPKSKQSPKQPSFVVTKPSPVRKTPKQKKSSPRKSPKSHNVSQKSQNVSPRSPNVSLKSPNVKKSRTPHVTPKRASTFAATRSSARGSGDHSVSKLTNLLLSELQKCVVFFCKSLPDC